MLSNIFEMNVYNSLSYIILGLLSFYIIYVIISFFHKDRIERIKYIRSYKKGKFTFIFLPVFFLLFMGTVSKPNVSATEAFFSSLSNTVSLLALKFETNNIQYLLNSNSTYRGTVYFCYYLIFVNAMLFFVSLFSQKVFELISILRLNSSKKKLLLIVGYNNENNSIISSVCSSEYNTIVIGALSNSDCNELYLKGILYINSNCINLLEKRIKKLTASSKSITIIVNTNNDEINITFCNAILLLLYKNKFFTQSLEVFAKLRINVFGSPKYNSIYQEIESKGSGSFHFINKYKLIALDFIDRFPVTSLLNETHIDYSRAIIKDQVQITYCIIGFGKTTQELLLSLISNNQLISSKDGEIVHKSITYNIIDINNECGDKNYFHCINRYYGFIDYVHKNKIENQYLTLAPCPGEINYYPNTDINSSSSIEAVYKSTKGDSPLSVLAYIISFGSDYENLDYTKKLIENLSNWNIINYHIYVKVRKKSNESIFEFDERVSLFAIEDDVVFNINKITRDPFLQMAMLRDKEYENEKAKKNDELFQQEEIKWYRKDRLKRKNSLYSCLNIETKLNLMGLATANNGNNTDSLFLSRYTSEIRKNLAIQEHYRWNAFLICSGFLPATEKSIISDIDNGTCYSKHRHANICDWSGLDAYANIIMAKNNCNYNEADVKVYDYQLMDEILIYLNHANLKITKK